jgi:tRNA threonylcarbamoyladenosine biosynthesis protein TsaE
VCISRSPEETRALGRALAQRLAAGDLVCLFGELGAGKTTLMQGLAEGLGSPEPATSPSFTLIHEHGGRVRLYHLDLYRLRPQDLAEAGIEEALGADGVVAVEWAERLPEELRAGALEIQIEFDEAEPATRRVRFHPLGPRSARIVDDMMQESDACPSDGPTGSPDRIWRQEPDAHSGH